MKVKDNTVLLVRVLSSSTGRTDQAFSGCLLPENIWVLEEETWRKWQRVDDFSQSDGENKHYILDRETGNIRFGDGVHGRRPPVGSVIKATYHCGAGEEGALQVGRTISLSGLGEEFSEEYLVKKRTHGIRVGYEMSFRVTRSEEEDQKGVECTTGLLPFGRNRYFYGKLLTVADFDDEQEYFASKNHKPTTKKCKKESYLMPILLDAVKCLDWGIDGEVRVSVVPNKAVLIEKVHPRCNKAKKSR